MTLLNTVVHLAVVSGLQAAGCSAFSPASNPLLRRDNCVTNCPSGIPQCSCAADETCELSPQTCSACASTTCVKTTAANPDVAAPAPKHSTPIGGIIGGILGAFIVIGLLGFFFYRWHKKKRDAMLDIAVPWQPEKSEEQLQQLGQLRDARASTHTVTSIASTALTRASNVIQIAYIPGVTNRSNPNSPSFLVPPVPPLPGGNPSPYQHGGDRQFFSAEDILRQSMWSTNSDNRSSVATTIYRNNAVISPAATTAVRAKVAVVTVNKSPNPASSNASTIGDSTPPVPAIDFSRITQTAVATKVGGNKSGSPQPSAAPESGPLSPAFSIGSTFLAKSSASKPKNLYLTPQTQRLSKVSITSSLAEEMDEEDEAEEHAGPFTDRASIDDHNVRRPIQPPNSAGRSIPATFQDGDIRMSFRPISAFDEAEAPLTARGKSPFGDENRIQG